MEKYDNDRKGVILAEAALIGDPAATAKYGVSARTLRRWRSAAKQDGQLAESIRVKKAAVLADWGASVREARGHALYRAIELLHRCDSLRDVAGALKIFHDAILAEELLAHGQQSRDGDGVGLETRQGSAVHRAAERLGGRPGIEPH